MSHIHGVDGNALQVLGNKGKAAGSQTALGEFSPGAMVHSRQSSLRYVLDTPVKEMLHLGEFSMAGITLTPAELSPRIFHHGPGLAKVPLKIPAPAHI